MAKDASLFSSLSDSPKENIYVTDDCALTVSINGDIECQNSHVSDSYNVPSLSANLLSVVQPMKTKKTVELWSY